MALTVRELIEKLEKAEDDNANVFIETVDYFLSVDLVFIDKDKDIIFANVTELDDETYGRYKKM